MAVQPCFSTWLHTLRAAPSVRGATSIKRRLDVFRYPKAFLSIPPPKDRNCEPPKRRLPAKAWDSHMHVVETRYPVVADAAYKPTPHTIGDAMAFEASIGVENVVLVQPSIYGFDNSCLLDALRRIGPSRGRGVVVIDPDNTDIKTLTEWHSLGVRGVRVNFKSSGKVPSRAELESTLSEHARLIRSLGWMLQIHTSMRTIPLLEEIIPHLGVKICIDHFGGPELGKVPWEQGGSFDPYSLPGFSSLISLLQSERTYVKISAPYRLSMDEGYRDLEIMIREFLRQAPNKVLYATDWPHTRFSGIDIKPFTELCLGLCGSQALAERVFRLNAEELMEPSLGI
ncbi:putative TIM barrel metal-dependent hydrolase [Aspergillus lucknowensis]|uniref:Amidohydrolase-related domain-containing protein n=1 Tax=Aspergillus lucknowensis TaxID=176173 RepID=A0ABR4M5H8_9EURO